MNENKMKQKEQVQGQKIGYEEFATEIKDRIQKQIGTGADVILKEMEQNNGGSRIGLLIHKKNEKVAPVIYLEPYYACYLEGDGIDEVAKEVYTAWFGIKPPEGLESFRFQDYEKVKQRVLFKLVNYGLNEKLLSKVPHQRYLDLAVVFYCPLAEDERIGKTSVLIRKEHLALWGITEEELAAGAYQNTPRLLEYQLIDMEKIIRGLLPGGEETELPESKDKAPEMLVLTNKGRINGAACLLYPHLLEKLAKEKNASFIILPSSIHELILVPVREGMEKDKTEAYTQMVKEVNQTELAEEEILSDHAYFYDRFKAEVYAV